MADKILGAISAFIIATIASLGYGGVALMMAIESACIPLPSEVIMPFAGYLVSTGRFELQLVAIAGAVGCLLGSYLAYFVGASGGRCNAALPRSPGATRRGGDHSPGRSSPPR